MQEGEGVGLMGEASSWDTADSLGRLTDEEAAGLQDVLAIFEASRERLEARMRELAARWPDVQALLEDDPTRGARSQQSRALLREGVEARDIGAYLARAQQDARELAGRGVAFATVVRWLTRMVPLVQAELVAQLGEDQERLVRGLTALARLVGALLSVAGAEYADVRRELLEQEYRRVLRELSVPVVPVWHGVLVVPLVGVLDSARARELTQTLLESIARERARVAILDVTGVPAVDTQVADYLLRTVKAARLLGAQSVLVGIRPAIAQTLVRLGVDLHEVATEADLQSGLAYALRLMGLRIVEDEDAEDG
ncbi:STAS domain-containing protein [Geochorda subterranea]|uniref:STAS domain-containing protein n=1 Tax=Geochorda subterranea TaxID=3109564 RepID=A0ABZ1BSH8_9FIRM|nr:STAS domain-containing protein [Limnochorda sp. LNt]WRP15790.1 STAS domain-containing protein [Limnochorda sp. LNt]